MAAEIDQARSCQLDDVGGGHYRAAIVIETDGSENVWLIDGDPDTPDHCTPGWNRRQEHEQLGPLPSSMRYRMNRAYRRCLRPTASGRRCLKHVVKHGDPCHLHAGVRNG